ncbi:ATP/GTP-binding protein [Neisseria sp. MVDL20-010259]|uniref:AAA family ATPase n=1 Tax=Neisseria sp. MVDL20-010259 TaxID=3061170 RepID=UPI00265F8E41|nr:ATP-binding protein [Neisseria sp. MVDL20-010259]MDO1563632.1 ATP-binding protein [Neisseria sp. MVDL20-010259]
MLIDFTVSNYRSFREQQNFSMVKTKGDEQPSNTFRIENIKGLELLKTAAIYGANASGKSNFLKALETMKRIVTNTSQRGDKLPLAPFKLDKKCLAEPTEFEITFIVQNIRYQYGFSATESQIFDEWLFAYPKGHSQKWFERIWDNEVKKHHWKFSSFLLGTKQVWQQATRDNALFLSTAVQLNSEQLKPLFDWFDNNLKFSGVNGFSPGFTVMKCTEGKKDKIVRLLKAADFNIDNISVKTEDFDPSHLPDDMPEPLKEFLSEKLIGKKGFDLETIHQDNHGNPISFDFDDESDGTQKFFSFAGPILDVLENGYTLCIDELNVNMHPKLVQFLVELFHAPANNPKNAQLIFTTHETSILNQNVFRRDQIWFCERDNKQSSILYPLSDFSPKKGKENLEAGYLSGRYGALPFIDAFNLER